MEYFYEIVHAYTCQRYPCITTFCDIRGFAKHQLYRGYSNFWNEYAIYFIE